ncbi:TIGR00730 family Rossman fold protein [Halarcobacter mediterraneus]|uniref:Cytokinin riboside 5'-monophosphate phosphoribohydrolase n=1 Tax=Halarcobacter mediterraneus TaxID=2023153 RepID=A0A4Q1AWQ9_9BACT|nr:TIGR00730 family Rossman fold protein [Halarcobacter mediterraneus]RXK14594.1 TIGR00730 family Rossman fold protein [Halarcobacter mediterraneus]
MKVAIYCGSSSGNDNKFIEQTKKLGKYLAQNNIDLVYGGGKVGLMGTIADSFLENGAKVYGVIPEKLVEKELAHPQLTDLTIVKTMHERKAIMAEMADAFITLPGGAGTLEEIFEAWTWAQLGYHNKPCAFYNIDGFYDDLFNMLETMTKKAFLKEEYLNMLINTSDEKKLLSEIKSYKAPSEKWN